MKRRVRRVLVSGCVAGVALALPPVSAGAGGGCHRPAGQGTAPVAGTEVTMEKACFTPAVLAVEPNTTVRFFNEDTFAHVVLGTGWGTADNLLGDDVYERTFTGPGTYPYSCYLHPTMNGAILVSGAGDAGIPVDVVKASLSSPASQDGFETGTLGLGALVGAAVALGTTRWFRRRSAVS